jgi:predicted peptidase
MTRTTRTATLPAVVLLIAGSLTSGVHAATATRKAVAAGRQEPQSLPPTRTNKAGCRYWLYLPADYGKQAGRKWPLMLFLHGVGGCGDDLERVKEHGPPRLIEQGKEFPFIVVSPQCPKGQMWSADVLNTLLDAVIKEYSVDQDRVYCTGLSMGGYGTWSLATAYPQRFAAIVPICGGGQPAQAARLKPVPIWAFHGARDSIVPVSESEQMVDAVKKVGGDAKLTVYPKARHNCWARAYSDPEVYDWLLAHRRAAAAKQAQSGRQGTR